MELTDPGSTAHADPAAVYARRSELYGVSERRLTDRSRSISYCRVATFVGAAVCLIVAFTRDGTRGPWLYAAGGLLVVAFIALVAYHSRVEVRARRYRALRRVNDLALARLRRDWAQVPTPPPTAPPLHPYADDLDLFGHASLFTLLWSGGSEMGRQRLADWLLAPADPATVRRRQQAIDELAPRLELRQQMLAAAETGSLESHRAARFLEWAEGKPWLSAHPIALWAIRGLTAAIVVPLALQILGFVQEFYWIVPVVVAFVVSNVFAVRIEHVFDRAFAQHAVFRHYAELFQLISSADVRSPLSCELQQALIVEQETAERQMNRLQRLMELADLRHSALVHLPVQILTLWDFHVVIAVERWQRRAGRHARQWLDTLATFEALAALAALRFDNPAWALPDVADGPCVLDASEMGHPLLAGGVRVNNDISVGPPGTFLLVTGSNMSGKSTLLRAIGLNVVLAQAGGPACATRMRLPPVRLYTSMRVQDSLEEGVSFFMAAVKRLKQVVEAAGPRPIGAAGDPCRSPAARGDSATAVLLYLLDEVLQGTNTAERQIAVRSVLRHLLARAAIGAVTTHDLTLADTQDLAAAAHSVHFTEQLQSSGAGAVMTFDYRLRPGLATSQNALRLMQMVGLDV